MPIQLNPPIEETFVLERSDAALGNEGDSTTVTIKQALEGENLLRAQLWKRFERTVDEMGRIFVSQDVSPAEVKRKEIFLTMIGCNLEIPTGRREKGEPVMVDGKPETKPLFKFPLVEREFLTAYAQLPPIVADEIHEKVLEVNITWAIEGED